MAITVKFEPNNADQFIDHYFNSASELDSDDLLSKFKDTALYLDISYDLMQYRNNKRFMNMTPVKYQKLMYSRLLSNHAELINDILANTAPKAGK